MVTKEARAIAMVQIHHQEVMQELPPVVDRVLVIVAVLNQEVVDPIMVAQEVMVVTVVQEQAEECSSRHTR